MVSNQVKCSGGNEVINLSKCTNSFLSRSPQQRMINFAASPPHVYLSIIGFRGPGPYAAGLSEDIQVDLALEEHLINLLAKDGVLQLLKLETSCAEKEACSNYYTCVSSSLLAPTLTHSLNRALSGGGGGQKGRSW